MAERIASKDPEFCAELAELDLLSNLVIDWLDLGRFDDAMLTCVELRRRYPDTMDWITRTGEVHEARGEFLQAIDYFRRCIAYIDEHAADCDAEWKEDYRRVIEQLEARRAR